MSCFRVKYRIEYDSVNDLYRLPKAPELIKIANVVALDVFYDSGTDYTPLWVDLQTLQYDYGQQIFFDVANENNMLFLDTAISGPCLNAVYKKINISFVTSDIPGDNVSGDYIPQGDEDILIG